MQSEWSALKATSIYFSSAKELIKIQKVRSRQSASQTGKVQVKPTEVTVEDCVNN